MRTGYRLVAWAARSFFRVAFGLVVKGSENVPRIGPVVLAANHRSDFDPPLLGGVIPREVHFFAKEELFRSAPLRRLISYLNAFPVRRGQVDRKALRVCLDVLKNGRALLMFPEGTRAPSDGFLRAKLGIGWVISLSGAPVLPVYVHGSTERWPRWRGRPGIRVVFGPTIPASDLRAENLSGKELYQHVADAVLEHIRALSLTTPGGCVVSRGTLYERDVIEDTRLR
jgi:1-acyl-sn-glycerol-3-phosphate acyltransferase